MADINAATWFEIPVTDMARAVRFYTKAFGIELHEVTMGPSKMAWFPMAPNAPGSGGTLIHDEGYVPSREGSLVYLAVDDIDGTLARVTEAGGRTLLPKTNIGEHGNIAHFEDSEGNRVALHSPR
ncbi:MAG TPA: VOC family protein [Gammaproteobacteria bacterium]|nr:VOC family protein [Gammaproteobacteria bacterium]